MARPKKQTISFIARRRFEMWDFCIKPILAGASHTFTHHDYSVEVTLPDRPSKREMKERRNAPLDVSTFRKRRNGAWVPEFFYVNQIDVTIDPHSTVSIKPMALGSQDRTLFTLREEERLNRALWQLEADAYRVLLRWLNVIRWKAGIPSLRRPVRRLEVTDTRLYEKGSGKEFYSTPLHYVVPRRPVVTRQHWAAAQAFLSSGDEVPAWQIYLVQAHHRLSLDDQRGCVLALAIAFETMLNKLLSEFVLPRDRDAFAEMVLRMSTMSFVESWRKLGFDSARWAKAFHKEALKNLLVERNSIMHRGSRRKSSHFAEAQRTKTLARNFCKLGQLFTSSWSPP